MTNAAFEAIIGYTGIPGRWVVCTTTTILDKPDSFAHTVHERPNVVFLYDKKVCDECAKKPLTQRLKCTHVKFQGNPFLSHKIKRKFQELTDPAQILTILEEFYGLARPTAVVGYDKEKVVRIFDEAHKWKKSYPRKRIGLHFAYVDPNAGGLSSDAAIMIIIFDMEKCVFVITWMDSKSVHSQKEFRSFVLDNIEAYHKKIRCGLTDEPICIAVESQSRFDGETIREGLDIRLLRGRASLANVHIMSDKSRILKISNFQYDREGVNINQTKQKLMHKFMWSVLENDMLYHHEDMDTISIYKINFITSMFIEQMCRYRTPSSNENTGYGPNGQIRSGDVYGGKTRGKKDDLSDCGHGALEWFRIIMTDPFYRSLLVEMGVIDFGPMSYDLEF